MIVREAYRNITLPVCRAHYDGRLALPGWAPSLGRVQDARDDDGCLFCGTCSDWMREDLRELYGAPAVRKKRSSRAPD